MNTSHDDTSHGNSIAAWPAVITATIGVTIVTVGYLFSNGIMLLAGGVLTLVSIPLGAVLSRMGYGIAGKNNK